jgi:hypothetical protein
MASNKIIRVTMFKIPSAEDQEAALAAYKKLTIENKKVLPPLLHRLLL